MGFPHGSDEDAAFIISWLELNNFRGVSLLANSIKELDQKEVVWNPNFRQK